MNTPQIMFFRVNPKSQVGKCILRIRLAVALGCCTFTSGESLRLAEEAVEMHRRAGALYDMARLARETGRPFRYAWLHLCGTLVFYRGDWSSGRSMKFIARTHRSLEKAKGLRELLGYDDTF